MSKQRIINLFLLFFLALVLPGAVLLVQQTNQLGKKATSEAAVRGEIAPASATKNRGETFTVTVNLTNITSADKIVRASSATLQYDPLVFTINNLTTSQSPQCGPQAFPTTPCDTQNFPDEACARVDDNEIELSCYRRVALGTLTLVPNQAKSLASFSVTVKNTAPLGPSTIQMTNLQVPKANDPTNSDYADGKVSATYTIVSGTTTTPSPTSTPPPGQVSIQLKVKFAGINTARQNQHIKVFVKKRGDSTLNHDMGNVAVVSNASGVYQSEMINLPSSITAGSGYYFLVKGPKHLNTRYCANTGQNRPCELTTTASIVLADGDNVLDFSTFSLPGGDLPIPTQDGVVNSADAVVMVNCFADPTSADCVAKADLNLDGIISSIDTNIMNDTIYTRWEDQD